jgi:hypothetical protein
MSDSSLTGHWEGHYKNLGKEFPIRAELRQNGELLAGTMIDVLTGDRQPYSEVAAASDFPMLSERWCRMALLGFWGWLWRRQEPVSIAWELPASATIDGVVRDGEVSFCKSYQGSARTTVEVADKSWELTLEDHRVMYEGRLASADLIEGEWIIPPDPDRRIPSAFGAFVLRRVRD